MWSHHQSAWGLILLLLLLLLLLLKRDHNRGAGDKTRRRENARADSQPLREHLLRQKRQFYPLHRIRKTEDGDFVFGFFFCVGTTDFGGRRRRL